MLLLCASWLSTIGTLFHTLNFMSSSVRKKFAIKIKNIRIERNLSQEDLALLCGIDRTYIGRLERLERNPSLEILQKIADGLKIKLHDLLKFD